MQDEIEQARLLARFKLAIRRQLDQSVDLERLVHDKTYAHDRLAEIENAADDEDLLVMVLTLREQLLPPPVLAEALPPSVDKPAASRDYKFGARGW